MKHLTEISTRVQHLSLEKQILLAHRLEGELAPAAVNSGKNSPDANIEQSQESVGISYSERDIELLEKRDPDPHTGPAKQKRLIAYIVLSSENQTANLAVNSKYSSSSNELNEVIAKKSNKQIDKSQLRNLLKEKLPEFMVPSVFMVLENLPRNSNGKIDYRALPDPVIEKDRPGNRSDAPMTDTQKELKNIWSQALDIEQIGIYDNFFELGGHSLLIAQIISKIRSILGVEIAMRSLFDYPTIETLGEAINTLLWVKTGDTTVSPELQSDREEFEI